MTPADKKMIREFREKLSELAKMSQEIVQKGYTLSFNINSDKGVIDKFEVRGLVDLDDDESPRGRTN